MALKSHPDKGGSEETHCGVHEAYQQQERHASDQEMRSKAIHSDDSPPFVQCGLVDFESPIAMANTFPKRYARYKYVRPKISGVAGGA